MFNIVNRLRKWLVHVVRWMKPKRSGATFAAPTIVTPAPVTLAPAVERPGDWLLERQASGQPTPILDPPAAVLDTPPSSSSEVQPRIFGEIDLGQYGKVVKREEDQWLPKPKRPRAKR